MKGKEWSVLKMAAYKAKSAEWRDLQADLVVFFLLVERISTKDAIMDACFDLHTKHNYEEVMKIIQPYTKIVKQGTVWSYALNSNGRRYALESHARYTMYKTVL